MFQQFGHELGYFGRVQGRGWPLPGRRLWWRRQRQRGLAPSDDHRHQLGEGGSDVRQLSGRTGQLEAGDGEVTPLGVEPDLGQLVARVLRTFRGRRIRRRALRALVVGPAIGVRGQQELRQGSRVAEQLDTGAARADLGVGAAAVEHRLRPRLDPTCGRRQGQIEVDTDQPPAVVELAEHDARPRDALAVHVPASHHPRAPGGGVRAAGATTLSGRHHGHLVELGGVLSVRPLGPQDPTPLLQVSAERGLDGGRGQVAHPRCAQAGSFHWRRCVVRLGPLELRAQVRRRRAVVVAVAQEDIGAGHRAELRSIACHFAHDRSRRFGRNLTR